jgi:hypothetical protein
VPRRRGLELDGEDLRGLPLGDRKNRLCSASKAPSTGHRPIKRSTTRQIKSRNGRRNVAPAIRRKNRYCSRCPEDFAAIASACGLTHIRDVKAFVSKVMVFDKPEAS